MARAVFLLLKELTRALTRFFLLVTRLHNILQIKGFTNTSNVLQKTYLKNKKNKRTMLSRALLVDMYTGSSMSQK